jgi:pyruvate/2-oxoglutarate/acetoin dehydrogenase E1 component
MRYIEYINSIIKDIIKKEKKLILYGQNIVSGSCLSGLTRGLESINTGLTINTPNSENTLVGVGFGMMLNNTSSIFFMKQMDFLLLGIDHLVNTYNIIRQNPPTSSFTIFPISVDSGYEGPQSALNNLNDFSSIAELDVYSFTNKRDTKKIISKYLVEPGFRIMSPSQRLLQKEVIDIDILQHDNDCNFFHYKNGDDATIVCFNYSIPYGSTLHNSIRDNGMTASLFSVNCYSKFDYSYIINDLKRTNTLIIIDDSKSVNKSSEKFLIETNKYCNLNNLIILDRSEEQNRFYPLHDQLEIDYQSVVNKLMK